MTKHSKDNTEPQEESSTGSMSSISCGDEDKSPTSRQEKMKKDLAKTRDNVNSLLSDETFQLPEDGIEAFNMLPDALNTGMFDSDVFGDLGDLDDD